MNASDKSRFWQLHIDHGVNSGVLTVGKSCEFVFGISDAGSLLEKQHEAGNFPFQGL
jgi:hypothetical protein